MIFILGIDALDYELVEKLNLNNLKQIEHNKIVVPINEKRDIPFSPEVWGAFLTGEYMPIEFVSASYYINMLKKGIAFLHIDLDKGLPKKIKNILRKYFDFSSPNRFGNLNRETFLDITNSYKINVPFYNFDYKTIDVGHLFGISEYSLEQAIREIKSIYKNRKRQILNEINSIKNKDVVFAYIHTTDILQHFSYLHISEIKKHYMDLDNYISDLKLKLENSFEDVIFIIVSDHGFDFEIGNHSMKGFYSSNTHLISRPEKITDFYGIILNIVDKKANLNTQF